MHKTDLRLQNKHYQDIKTIFFVVYLAKHS